MDPIVSINRVRLAGFALVDRMRVNRGLCFCCQGPLWGSGLPRDWDRKAHPARQDANREDANQKDVNQEDVNQEKVTDMRKRNRRGATLVEFALCAPILFFIVFAIIEGGRLLMVQNALTTAAREGCRMAVLATTTDANQIQTAVDRHMDIAAPTAECSVKCSPDNLSAVQSGTTVTVNVTLSYADISWIPHGLLLGDIRLAGSAIQARE